MKKFHTLKWEEGKLIILDQTRLPGEEKYIALETGEDVFRAIKTLQVRGAPAIGVAAAYGLVVTMKNTGFKEGTSFSRSFREVKDYLSGARPTAVNLTWALDRLERKLTGLMKEFPSWGRGIPEKEQEAYLLKGLLEEARAIHREDEEACRAMGEGGLTLLKPGMSLLTHCNAGALATTGYGTALAPIYIGQERGYDFRVFADETRPLLQGARLTAWELSVSGVDATLICDNMAASVMKKGLVDAILVGCDRMAANGDGANKIGTSSLGILAKEYGIPLYMFVPTSTIDLDTATGEEIVIEERGAEEVYRMWYREDMAPRGIKVFNPAFDVTDNRYITAVVTEKGVVLPPYEENLTRVVGKDEEMKAEIL